MRNPTVHMNGSARQSLLDGFCDAGSAVQRALAALDACAPNARDYYPQGPDAFAEAVREHGARLAHLQAVYRDLQALAEAVSDA